MRAPLSCHVQRENEREADAFCFSQQQEARALHVVSCRLRLVFPSCDVEAGRSQPRPPQSRERFLLSCGHDRLVVGHSPEAMLPGLAGLGEGEWRMEGDMIWVSLSAGFCASSLSMSASSSKLAFAHVVVATLKAMATAHSGNRSAVPPAGYERRRRGALDLRGGGGGIEPDIFEKFTGHLRDLSGKDSLESSRYQLKIVIVDAAFCGHKLSGYFAVPRSLSGEDRLIVVNDGSERWIRGRLVADFWIY